MKHQKINIQNLKVLFITEKLIDIINKINKKNK